MNQNSIQKIGIIGAGWWAAANHIPTLVEHPLAEVGGICSLDSDTLTKIQNEFGIAFAVKDYRSLLQETSLDGVIISSPHVFHYEHARAALEAGCHVMVEKPFTTSSSQAKELLDLANELGLSLNVSHGWNYMPITRKALSLIREGLVGEVQHAVLQLVSPTGDLFSGKGLILAKDALVQPQNSTWADASSAGGYGWGQLTHLLGLFFKLVDEVPEDVFAFTSMSEIGVDYYDAISMRLQNGATCVVSGSSNMPSSLAKFQVDIRIFGSKGNLLLDLEPGRERVVVEMLSGETRKAEIKTGDGEYDGGSPVHHLVDVCTGSSEEDMAPGIVGLHSVAVVEAMHKSAVSGRAEKAFSV